MHPAWFPLLLILQPGLADTLADAAEAVRRLLRLSEFTVTIRPADISVVAATTPTLLPAAYSAPLEALDVTALLRVYS